MGQVLHSFSGVRVCRVIDRAESVVPEHSHDWPVLSLFVLGSYRNVTALGPLDVGGPSAVLYRAGAAHQNTALGEGFEQIEIEFDPAWLGPDDLPAAPVRRWVGGDAGSAARHLAGLCSGALSEADLRAGVRRILAAQQPQPPPTWADVIDRRLRAEPGTTVQDLARHLGLHPAWLGTAYAAAMGESIPAASARLRVERAARLLRETDEPPAAVAIGAGFCDQSHLTRVFRRVLGRTPTEVRGERRLLRHSA